MEQNNRTIINPTNSGIYYGLLTGLVSIIFGFITFVTSQENNTAFNLLNYVILGAGIILAQKGFKSANKNYLSYEQGMGISMLLALINGVLSSLFYYIYCKFIDPDVVARLAKSIRDKMVAEGNTSDVQIDQIIDMTMKFSTGPYSIITGIVSNLFAGLLLALIITAVNKNSRSEFE